MAPSRETRRSEQADPGYVTDDDHHNQECDSDPVPATPAYPHAPLTGGSMAGASTDPAGTGVGIWSGMMRRMVWCCHSELSLPQQILILGTAPACILRFAPEDGVPRNRPGKRPRPLFMGGTPAPGTARNRRNTPENAMQASSVREEWYSVGVSPGYPVFGRLYEGASKPW